MLPLRFLFFLLPILVVSGCASVSVKETTRTPPPPAKLPEKILVRGFDTPEEAFRVDRSGENLTYFQRQKQERLTRQLVRRLSKHVAPAEAIATTAPVPRGNLWLLEGRFDRVNQGSRALRALIGFGLGGTKVETTAVLYELSGKKPREVLRIVTSGGSNAEPGAITGFNPFGIPWGMGINAIMGARTGLVFDTVRTSREIVAAVSEYAGDKDLIPDEKTLEPKRVGQIPPLVRRIFLPWAKRPNPENTAAPTEANGL